MKILQCEVCKGFCPVPETSVSIIRCSECNFQAKQEYGMVVSMVKCVVMPSLLDEAVRLDVDLTKPVPRHRPRSFA